MKIASLLKSRPPDPQYWSYNEIAWHEGHVKKASSYFTTCFLGLVMVAALGLAADLPPNGSLNVAYRQLSEGQLSESVHHIKLLCGDGRCSITTLSLNQCGRSGKRGEFYPKVERTSTQEGNLFLWEITNGELSAEEKHPEASFKYRFTYKVRQDPGLSKITRNKQTRWFGDLTGFSGAAIKDSSILGKVISWEMIPLKGKSPRIEAACQIMLDGVPHPHEILDR
jgi:hypothetical protein